MATLKRLTHAVVIGEPDDRETVMSGSAGGRGTGLAPRRAPHRAADPTSWMNDYGKLRRCTDRSGKVVDFYLYLAAILVTLRMLIRRSTNRCRWDDRPTARRLK